MQKRAKEGGKGSPSQISVTVNAGEHELSIPTTTNVSLLWSQLCGRGRGRGIFYGMLQEAGGESIFVQTVKKKGFQNAFEVGQKKGERQMS